MLCEDCKRRSRRATQPKLGSPRWFPSKAHPGQHLVKKFERGVTFGEAVEDLREQFDLYDVPERKWKESVEEFVEWRHEQLSTHPAKGTGLVEEELDKADRMIDWADRVATCRTDLSKTEALRRDQEAADRLSTDPVYVEYDDEYNDYGVFGVETGFCYLLSSERDARQEAERLNSRTSRKKRATSEGIWGAIEAWYEDRLAPEVIDWLVRDLGASRATEMTTQMAGNMLIIKMDAGRESEYDRFYSQFVLDCASEALTIRVVGIRGGTEHHLAWDISVNAWMSSARWVVDQLAKKAEY